MATTIPMLEIAAVAYKAGFRGTAGGIAVAIAQAESSGEPDALSKNPDGGTNVGLWQIDTKDIPDSSQYIPSG